MGAVALIELVEDVLPGLRGNARALVLHGEHNAAIRANQPQPHRSVGRVELHGVADQVAPHVHQQPRVAPVADLLQIDVEFDLLFAPPGLQRQDRLAHLLVQAEHRGLPGDGLVLHLGQKQNVADQAGQPVGVVQNLVHVLALLRRGPVRILEQHGVALDGVDGGLELVGDVGDEVGLEHLGLFQLRDHHVEVPVELLNVAALASAIDAELEIAARHAIHGAAQVADGPQDAVVQKQGDDARQRAADHQHPDEAGDRQRHAKQPVQHQDQAHAHQNRQAHLAEDGHGEVKAQARAALLSPHVRTTL